MTIRSDIAAHDGTQLGRAPLIAPHEQRTLANATKLVRTLGDVPLAHHLEALSRRLSGPSDQHSALVPEVPEHVSGLNGFTSFPASPSDEMTEAVMVAEEDRALSEAYVERSATFVHVEVAVSC